MFDFDEPSGIEWRVRLVNQRNTDEKVIFDVTPEVSESRTVNYKNIEPVHNPGNVLAYVNSAARVFNITQIQFVSRTPNEAKKTIDTLHLLKGWCAPYFAKSEYEIRGAPPDVLLFSAYSSNLHHGKPQHISKVPVVLTSLNNPYPTDADYINANDDHNTPVPTIMTLDITLMEVHSGTELLKFNLANYKQGRLPGF